MNARYHGLTHRGRVTHICVSNLTIINSDNGLLPGRRQAIIGTNAGILLMGALGINYGEMLIDINTFAFKKIHLKMSAKRCVYFVSDLMCWYTCWYLSIVGIDLIYMRIVPKITKIYVPQGIWSKLIHYIDVIMTTIASQITSLAVVYSIVYSGVDQRKHQSSASLAFVRGIHRDRWIPRTKGQ